MEQFDKVASLYSRVRPSYPQRVYQEMVNFNEGNLFSFAADIGCGPGQSTEGLIPIAQKVIGIEPGDHLREEASKHYPRISFYKGTGEQTNLSNHEVDLVTIAAAFYWMDREQVLAEVNRILKDKGIFCIYRYFHPVVEDRAVDQVIQKHLVNYWNQYREDRFVRKDDSDQLMEQSGYFSKVKSLKIDHVIPMRVSDFMGFLGSTAYVSLYLESIGSDADAYLGSLEDELRPHTINDYLDINFDIRMVCAKK